MKNRHIFCGPLLNPGRSVSEPRICVSILMIFDILDGCYYSIESADKKEDNVGGQRWNDSGLAYQADVALKSYINLCI